MTKAATVAFLLQFDLSPHHGVAKEKFHHIVNTKFILDFCRSVTHAESKKATANAAHAERVLDAMGCQDSVIFCQDSVIFASDPRVIQGGNRG